MPDPSSTPILSPLDKYKLLRERIEFEYSLINQRVTWFVTSQSFLFTGYAVSLNFSAPGVEPTLQTKHNLILLHAIPVTAILICIVVYITLLAALHSIRALVALGRQVEHGLPGASSDGRGPWLGLVSGPRAFRAGMAAAWTLPGIFLVVWLILLINR